MTKSLKIILDSTMHFKLKLKVKPDHTISRLQPLMIQQTIRDAYDGEKPVYSCSLMTKA